ncbi:DoxX family protein [Mesorhizobium sp. ANAO-SY3R2]|uniref:DoxX family protein n=1 Tax=Mesorhizobium sp. ANAO-SY3R2 TaxID=3166644 RepID=UPI00366E078F
MFRNLLLLAARILIAVLFVPSGIHTLSNIASTTTYFGGLGFPLPILVAWGVGLLEFVGGASVLLGFQTRPVAILLGAFSFAAGFIGHYGHGGTDPVLVTMHAQALMKDIAIAGGLLALSAAGPGAFSVDRA